MNNKYILRLVNGTYDFMHKKTILIISNIKLVTDKWA